MLYHWKNPTPDQNTIQQLRNELNIHPVLAQLLVQRNIHNYDEAEFFFRPQLSHLHDPFLMKDMEQAVHRIIQAIEQQQQVMIYGDYDVDGTTSVALMHSFLKDHISNLSFYIPDRYQEGYGISYQSIDHASEQNVDLVIALDCGITAVEKIEYANEKGIDYIICDHHLPKDTIPAAIAVLDPKQPNCTYPYKELSGCGIGLKLAQAVCQRLDLEDQEWMKYLDLATVSIASDIVPLTGENRTIAYHGLQKINSNPSIGIRSLLSQSKIEKELTITDVVFVIGPRINAAGRMGDAKNAVRMLIAETAEEANKEARVLDSRNTDRRALDQQITEEAIQLIDSSEELQNRKSTVLFGSEWHKGVIGIVASRVMEKHYRPTIILTESGGKATGSARSVQDYNIHHAIGQCDEWLENYGGHMYAAGLTLKKENIENFSLAFERVVKNSIREEQLIPSIRIDAELPLAEINYPLFRIINQFAPFGPQNMKPVFVARNVIDAGFSRVLKDEHLKLHVKQGNGRAWNGIAFGMANKADLVLSNKTFDICYQIDENEWNGRKSLQLIIKDIKPSTSSN